MEKFWWKMRFKRKSLREFSGAAVREKQRKSEEREEKKYGGAVRKGQWRGNKKNERRRERAARGKISKELPSGSSSKKANLLYSSN